MTDWGILNKLTRWMSRVGVVRKGAHPLVQGTTDLFSNIFSYQYYTRLVGFAVFLLAILGILKLQG